MAALESAVNNFENFVQFTPVATKPVATAHVIPAQTATDEIRQIGEAVAANAELQIKVNDALIARIVRLEDALNATNAVVRRLGEEARARG